MQWDIVILIIFFVLIIPFSVRIKFEINILRNKGKILILLFGLIPVFFEFIEINNGFIRFIKNPKRIRQIKITFKKETIKTINISVNTILNSQIIKEFDIQTAFGLKNQPFYVALASGIYNSIIATFFSINCAKKNIINSHNKLKTYFKYNYLKTKINAKVRLSIYDIVKIFIQIKCGVSA